MSNNIKIQLDINAKDCFLYMDNLFVIDQDNSLKYINLRWMYDKYLLPFDDIFTKPLFSSFIDNKYFNYHKYKNDDTYKRNYSEKWAEVVANPIELKIEDQDWKHLFDLPDSNILDFIVYAKKILIAFRSGVYEANLEFNDTVSVTRKLERIHDVKAHSLSTKIGELLIMSNFDGIFQGSLWQNYQKININKQPIIQQSSRVSWVNNNLLNYKDKSSYVFYQNEVEEVKESMTGVNFVVEDGSKKNLRIKNYGKDILDITDSINSISHNKQVSYAYNSNNYLFLLNTLGKIKAIEIDENGKLANSFDIYDRNSNINFENLGNPLSAHMVGVKAVTFEFFDQIISLKDGVFEVVSDMEVSQIKSYTNSKNYQNILS